MGKKGENIFKRKDGRYEARYVKERDQYNRILKYGFIYGRTYSEVKLKKEEKLKNIEKETNNNIILKQYMNIEILDWLEYKKTYLKKSTYYNYYTTIKGKIIPYFNNIKLKNITKETLNNYIQYLKCQNLSNKRIKDICIILRQFLKYKEINLQITLPKNNKNTINTLSKEEISLLINNLINADDEKKFAIILVLFTGLRIGELCALKWENINLDNKIIYINKTLSRIKKNENSNSKTEVILDIPKTDNSIRSIPIHDDLIEYLYKFKSNENNFFLTNTIDFISTNKYYYIYKKILNDLNMNKYNFHILRHTFATNALINGIDIKSLSEILGHSSVKITLDRYVHISIEEKIKQINKLSFDLS